MRAKKQTRFLAIKTNTHGDTYITTAKKDFGRWLVGGEVIVKGEKITILNLDEQTMYALKGCRLIMQDRFSDSQVIAFENEYKTLNADRLQREAELMQRREEQMRQNFASNELKNLKDERARRVEIFNSINNELHKASDFINDNNSEDISIYNAACRAFVELEKRFLDEISAQVRKIETR